MQIAGLYNGEVTIEFNPETHRYRLPGSKTYLISVTGCTGIIDKSRALVPWAIRLADEHIRTFLSERPDMVDKAELLDVLSEAVVRHEKVKKEAASVGGLVHAWAEGYALAKRDGAPMPPIGSDLPDQVISGINGFLDWINSHHVEFVDAERIVYSRTHDYVGITDVVAIVDGKKMIVDYKTAKGIYNEMRYQLAGYRGAYEEEMGKVDGSIILRFDKENGSFEAMETSDRDEYAKDYAAFLGCLAVKRREKELTK